MATNPTNIFIIDDEEPIRKVLNTHLSKEGFNVIQSSGGNPVFDALRANSFDIVISDLRMPEVNGTEILEFVKTNFDTVPVIMLTGFTDVSVAIDVLKKGAFDYLMKPVKKEDLMAAVRRAIGHRGLLVRNKELQTENAQYKSFLEQRVIERTKELNNKATELQKAYDLLKGMNLQFANALAETIEAKDHYTRGHCNRMKTLCAEMGRLIEMNGKDLETLEYAALLHDLGKIGVNESVLNKEGSLDNVESAHIKRHAEIGEKILLGVPLMDEVARIIAAHHENYDGTGYPKGLRGGEIPLSARLIAVADLFDAMRSDRPYRKGMPVEKIFSEMQRVSGTQLDPEMTNLFIAHKVYLTVEAVKE
ncbi:MAG: response regulator [Deltaproteobacteria bacterium]|nr:response regulator [Deltaproteobacteria bacterium]